jgi:hypothetical protein
MIGFAISLISWSEKACPFYPLPDLLKIFLADGKKFAVCPSMSAGKTGRLIDQ